jgi:TRAP-type uncharacterized transport system fused permease subunit
MVMPAGCLMLSNGKVRSYGKAMWHFWMQTEGVFGVALGVSASMIFLFVLFGAFWKRPEPVIILSN